MWETCKLAARCEPTKHYLSSESLWRWQLHYKRALAAHYLGDRKSAMKYGLLALEGNPTDARLINNMKFYNEGLYIV
jgi:hypothetical protein